MEKDKANLFRTSLRSEIQKRDKAKERLGELKDLSDDIQQGRAGGLSFTRLAQLLQGAGYKVSVDQVKWFCREHLKEEPRKRRRRRKRSSAPKAAVPTQRGSAAPQKTPTTTKHEPTVTTAGGRKGFRNVPDSEL